MRVSHRRRDLRRRLVRRRGLVVREARREVAVDRGKLDRRAAGGRHLERPRLAIGATRNSGEAGDRGEALRAGVELADHVVLRVRDVDVAGGIRDGLSRESDAGARRGPIDVPAAAQHAGDETQARAAVRATAVGATAVRHPSVRGRGPEVVGEREIAIGRRYDTDLPSFVTDGGRAAGARLACHLERVEDAPAQPEASE